MHTNAKTHIFSGIRHLADCQIATQYFIHRYLHEIVCKNLIFHKNAQKSYLWLKVCFKQKKIRCSTLPYK